MTYSALTNIILLILFFGSFFIGTILIWRFFKPEHEKAILLKLFGYALLAAFKFTLNSVPLPIGLIPAYFLQKEALQNKKSKQIAIVFGLISFFVWLYPFQNHIEQFLYPRDNINTYLQFPRPAGEEGFMVTISENSSQLILRSYVEKDEIGRSIYRAMAKSRKLDKFQLEKGWKYRFDIGQDTKSGRFRQLTFNVTNDGKLILLEYENGRYVFEGTQEFQNLLADFIKEFENTGVTQNG